MTFGLGGNAAPVTVRVVWPDGVVQEVGPVEVDGVVEVNRSNE